jgi:hypothetical protein
MPPFSTGTFEPVIRWVLAGVPLDRELETSAIRPAHLSTHRRRKSRCQDVTSVTVEWLAIH